jgi:hypothetical protein
MMVFEIEYTPSIARPMKEIELVSTENIKSYKVTFYNKDSTVTTKTVRTIRRCCFVGVISKYTLECALFDANIINAHNWYVAFQIHLQLHIYIYIYY